MDENQINDQERTVETNIAEKQTNVCNCTLHPLVKAILCGLLIFLGAFCAAYYVIDWHAKRLMAPFYGPMPMFETEYKQDMKMMDKIISESNKLVKGNNVIHMEQGKNDYKIMIDLRPFDNDEKNLDIKTEDNILTIAGRSVKKNKNKEQISRFQQSYMFGDNVKLDELQKATRGHYYEIIIPIMNNN